MPLAALHVGLALGEHGRCAEARAPLEDAARMLRQEECILPEDQASFSLCSSLSLLLFFGL